MQFRITKFKAAYASNNPAIAQSSNAEVTHFERLHGIYALSSVVLDACLLFNLKELAQY